VADQQGKGNSSDLALTGLRKTRKIVRKMRKSSNMLSPLFPEALQGILAAVTLHSEREWYLSDLAAYLGVRPSTLQRVLAKLVRSHILIRRNHGNRVYFHANPDCPILPELRGIMAKTVGIADVLRQAISPFRNDTSIAFIYGSVAEGRDVGSSDVDVLVVSHVSPSRIAVAIREPRERLEREVHLTVYTAREFAEKVSLGHHFLTALMSKPKIFLIGDEHELARLGEQGAGRAGADKQAGDG
jgi:predicted nucleotidyltransferase